MVAPIGLVAVVEDDPAMRKSMERLLNAHGYRTMTYSSAEAFLQSGAASAASVLIADIHLGGMSGIELRRHLLGAEPELPVIFITAYDDKTTRTAALASGCVDLLQKPFEDFRLIDALARSSMR